ncbi:MAG: UvrB/UvrC motif-containing protein [Candidatus Omnitrophica bacterium]|nr:UvrB/UvrC motif-containing protein [Candidatus Omnitrophota bacterium]
MLCDVCKKNEATVHLTQIIENKMQTVDLCETCSKAKGIDDPTGFSLAGLLLGLGAAQEGEKAPAPTVEQKCPRCGFTLDDFKKSGRFGCAHCYTTFAEPLQGLLKSMHKGTKHLGKVPQTMQEGRSYTERLRALQHQLELAIKAEDFEQAAHLRDKIKQTRTQLEQLSTG